MSSDTIGVWQPLYAEDSDPHSVPEYDAWCNEPDPIGEGYVCSRSLGHDGLHVAAYLGIVCCDSWGVHPDLRLPEGF